MNRFELELLRKEKERGRRSRFYVIYRARDEDEIVVGETVMDFFGGCPSEGSFGCGGEEFGLEVGWRNWIEL
jgi:hypothetical protein